MNNVRPTTMRPAMICAPEYLPEDLKIPTELVDVVHADLPILKKVIFIDCPDPDSTEVENLTALRKILPYCDVIINISTQQKYKNHRLCEELTRSTVGASMIWVQTHADIDVDIREDWRKMLTPYFDNVDRIYFVDSRHALEQRLNGNELDKEFAELTNLISEQIGQNGGNDIRRFQFLDITDDALSLILENLNSRQAQLGVLQAKVSELRHYFVKQITQKRKDELSDNRLLWEQRIRDEVVQRWGASPFSLALQIFGRLDKIILGSMIFRARSFTQLAVIGAMEGANKIRSWFAQQTAESLIAEMGNFVWSDADYRTNTITLNGYLRDAGIPEIDSQELKQTSTEACKEFTLAAGEQVDEMVRQAGDKNSVWYVRFLYEIGFLTLIGFFAWRPAKNFFYDSLICGKSLYGLDFYCITLFWFLALTAVLLLIFTHRTRRGAKRYLEQLQQKWETSFSASRILSRLQQKLDKIDSYRQDIECLRNDIRDRKKTLKTPLLSGRK